jgi:hypothetical protein
MPSLAIAAPRPELNSLINPLASLLPAPVTIHVSDHDLGSWILADDQRNLISTAFLEGRYLSEEELKPYEKRFDRGLQVEGLVSACPQGSAAWFAALRAKEGMSIDLASSGEPRQRFLTANTFRNQLHSQPISNIRFLHQSFPSSNARIDGLGYAQRDHSPTNLPIIQVHT